jgi:hypothetical protein
MLGQSGTACVQVEEWVLAAGVETVGQSWEELRFIRQAVEFLVLGAKQKKQLADIQHNLCSELSVQQLYRISTMYWDDKYGTETVSGEVLQQMRAIMQVRDCSCMPRCVNAPAWLPVLLSLLLPCLGWLF